MIFRNDMLIHELQWIIFDEVHYMRDKERGVVWEETMYYALNRNYYQALF